MYIHMCVILRVKFLNKHVNYTAIVFFSFSDSQRRKVKLGWLKQNHLSLTHNLLLTVIICSCSTISYFLLCAINCRRAQRPFLYKNIDFDTGYTDIAEPSKWTSVNLDIYLSPPLPPICWSHLTLGNNSMVTYNKMMNISFGGLTSLQVCYISMHVADKPWQRDLLTPIGIHDRDDDELIL